MPSLSRAAALRRRGRLLLARHRRLAVAALLALAVACGLRSLAPPPPPTATVWVAAEDLPAGHRLSEADLRRTGWPPGAVPSGALTVDDLDAAADRGARLAGPIRAGEPVTNARLVGAGLLAGQPPGMVAVTVRLAEPMASSLLHPGSVVDLLAAPAAATPAGGIADWAVPERVGAGEPPLAEVVASGVTVLAVPAAVQSRGWAGPLAAVGQGDGAGLLVVAADRAGARRLAAYSGQPMSAALRAQ